MTTLAIIALLFALICIFGLWWLFRQPGAFLEGRPLDELDGPSEHAPDSTLNGIDRRFIGR